MRSCGRRWDPRAGADTPCAPAECALSGGRGPLPLSAGAAAGAERSGAGGSKKPRKPPRPALLRSLPRLLRGEGRRRAEGVLLPSAELRLGGSVSGGGGSAAPGAPWRRRPERGGSAAAAGARAGAALPARLSALTGVRASPERLGPIQSDYARRRTNQLRRLMNIHRLG